MSLYSDNLPLGCNNDPSAPWNEVERKITISLTALIETEGNARKISTEGIITRCTSADNRSTNDELLRDNPPSYDELEFIILDKIEEQDEIMDIQWEY